MAVCSLKTTALLLLCLFISSLPRNCSPVCAKETTTPAPPSLKGDGIADETLALQALFNSSPAGTAMVLPAGKYRITKPLVIDLDTHGPFSLQGQGATLLIDGAGPALKLQGTHYKSADPSGFEKRVWQNQRMPLIDGLAITSRNPQADAIVAAGTMQLTISRVQIRNCRHAIRLVENNRNVILSEVHLYENSGVGVYLDDVNLHQINIGNSHISYNAQGGIVSRGGNVRNLHITGCDIESNMGVNEAPTANVLIDCSQSSAGTGEVAITGCTIQHNHKAKGSANVRLIGNSKPVEEGTIVREGHVTITGNIFSDVFTNVHLQHCRGVTMTGNTFWMGFDQNLLVEDCAHVVMGANAFDRNPRYSYSDSTTSANSLVFRRTFASTLSGLHISHINKAEAAILFEDCQRLHLTGCSLFDCQVPELKFRGCQNCRVGEVLISRENRSDDHQPLILEDCSGMMIKELDF